MSEACGCKAYPDVMPLSARVIFCPLHANTERWKRERNALLESAREAGADWPQVKEYFRTIIAACEKEEP